ncbi:MAG: hypothetical protein F6J87_07095 [Spirulina sp. SIO3F2]|nr:hypothetical protein [Spirulina sp. SIO3F2]
MLWVCPYTTTIAALTRVAIVLSFAWQGFTALFNAPSSVLIGVRLPA